MTGLLAWVQGLDGLVLALVIGGLLFVEEVGVPLPLAPGDLILAIGGIAIAAGKIPAVELIAIVMVTIVGGSMVGREVFELLGQDRLFRVARPLRIEAPLRRVSRVLQRQGWRAVFTARLIPGLRIHTTQVAGVIGMPRRTFIAGLAPAAAVYVAAFVGLGAAFGRPILEIIRSGEHQVLVVVLPLAAAAVLVLLLRGPGLRLLASLAPTARAGAWVLRLESPGILLIPAAIGLNFTGHVLASELKLPFFLDSIGTVLSALLAGPWVAAGVGLITNLVSSNSIDPIAAPYSAVSIAIGFAVGLAARQGWHKHPAGWLVLWALCFLIASVISTPLNLLLSDGHSGVALGDAVVDRLAKTLPLPVASYLGEAAIDLPDKLIAVLAATLVYRGWPQAGSPVPPLELDLSAAFGFVFRSERWLAKLSVASLCLLLSWLLIPFLLLCGYAVAVARNGSQGRQELPTWDRLGEKLKDGFLMSIVFLAWNVPPLVVSLFPQPLVIVGNLLGLLVLVLQPAIWSQYLSGGLRAAFDVAAVARRARFNLGLTLVVGALGIVLPVLGLLGLVGVLVGVLPAIAYVSLVVAFLFGEYELITRPTRSEAAASTGRSSAPG